MKSLLALVLSLFFASQALACGGAKSSSAPSSDDSGTDSTVSQPLEP